MRAPFILTLLSEDGYQVFAALHQQYETLERAIEGAKADYLRRYGGTPSFRVYHAAADTSIYRHTLIEVCFDESKRRSFVALYKVLEEVELAHQRPIPVQFTKPAVIRALRRILIRLGQMLPGSGGRGAFVFAR